MSYKKYQPNNKQSKKQKKKGFSPGKKRIFPEEALKIISFENALASQVQDEDIVRACSLYNQTQEKIIKARIAKIHFN